MPGPFFNQDRHACLHSMMTIDGCRREPQGTQMTKATPPKKTSAYKVARHISPGDTFARFSESLAWSPRLCPLSIPPLVRGMWGMPETL